MDVKSNQSPLIKINAVLADEVCAHFELAKESRALLRDDMRPREFVEALLKNKQYQVGIDFLAYALPVREAIWWGCLCLQHVGGNGPSGARGRLTQPQFTGCSDPRRIIGWRQRVRRERQD